MDFCVFSEVFDKVERAKQRRRKFYSVSGCMPLQSLIGVPGSVSVSGMVALICVHSSSYKYRLSCTIDAE